MTTTENLKKHIEDLEEKRLEVFFHMQKITAILNGRLYTYNIIIFFGALAVFFGSRLNNNDLNDFLILWSHFFSLSTIVLTLIQYIYTLDNKSSLLYKNICKIYKTYDDEYFVLKKFSAGEIDEDMIRQYYFEKSQELERYKCDISLPDWSTWIATSSFVISVILLFLA